MKVIKNKYIPFGRRYLAINLLGIIFTKGSLSPSQLRHEYIHTKQQIELAFIFFYLLYITEWLIRLVQYRSLYKAYINISFEREAYDNMYDKTYLKTRKLFSWFKYIIKTS